MLAESQKEVGHDHTHPHPHPGLITGQAISEMFRLNSGSIFYRHFNILEGSLRRMAFV